MWFLFTGLFPGGVEIAVRYRFRVENGLLLSSLSSDILDGRARGAGYMTRFLAGRERMNRSYVNPSRSISLE